MGSGSLASSYTDTVRIPAGSTVSLNGLSKLAKDLIVEGTLTHEATSFTDETIDVQVAGTLTLTKTGVIHANKKSTKTGNDQYYRYASHGGRAKSGDYSYTQGEYGSLTNPVSPHQHPACCSCVLPVIL